MKKVFALALILVFAFSSVSFAAVGSSRKSSSPSSIGSSMPKSSPSTQQAAPSTQGSNYKPSAPGSTYSDKAPASQTKPGVQQTPQQQSSGGFWRNAGMFGGGMLLGGMLSSMLGFGNMGGMMASVFGMIFNVIILAAIFMGIRYLWNKFRNNKKDM